jgi:extracellular elastinolytic metalloproteinase
VAAFPDRPARPTVLRAEGLERAIKASLVWFPLERLRLAWEVVLTLGDLDNQFRAIVDANHGRGAALQAARRHRARTLAVYRVDGGSPREMTDFPRPLGDYGLPLPEELPPGFPDPWIEARAATGNSVFAHLGDSGPTIEGDVSNGSVVFDPEDATGDDQKVLNIFYFNCVMHDFFYLLGFRERDGNFQSQTLGRGGIGGDRVDARSYPAAVWARRPTAAAR